MASRTCAILQPDRVSPVVEDPEDVQIKDIDPVLTLLCATYKLMSANPKRFCQKSSPNKQEYTWGIHHEDWLRAYAVIAFTKGRRSRTTDVPAQGPMQYVGVRGKTEKSEIYGYATLDVLSSVQDLEEGHYLGAAVEIVKEQALLDPEHDKEAMRKLEQRASDEQIARALDAIDSIRNKSQPARQSLIDNNDGTLEDLISEEVVNTLHAIAPGIDLNKTLLSTVPKASQREEITANERSALKDLLRETLRVYKISGSHLNLRRGNRYQKLQAITAAGDVTGLADEAGTLENADNLESELEFLRSMRALLGENLPEDQDLEEICESRGFNVETLEVSESSGN